MVADNEVNVSVTPEREVDNKKAKAADKKENLNGGSAKSAVRKDKRPKCQDLDTLEAVKAIVGLPEAEINGARQKRNDWHNQMKEAIDNNIKSRTRQHDELKMRRRPRFGKGDKVMVLLNKEQRVIVLVGN